MKYMLRYFVPINEIIITKTHPGTTMIKGRNDTTTKIVAAGGSFADDRRVCGIGGR